MDWNVVDVKVTADLTIQVWFADGTNGFVQFTPEYLTGVFEPLRDQTFFSRVFVDNGAVSWPGEIDLAPDAMYRELKQHGLWILK